MKSNFQSFLTKQTLSESVGVGITHVEDLDVEAFIRLIEKLHELEAVQKLDGANLRSGLDDDGKLFTSREQKGGKRFYSQKDFPQTSAYDGFRAAHAVLEQLEADIKSVLVPGEMMNLEIIYGSQPNTVFYGKDGYNYIAILEMIQGDDPTVQPNQKKISELVKLFHDKVITVKTIASDTHDGLALTRAPRLTDWKITRSDHVDRDVLKSVNLEDEISSLQAYLQFNNKEAHKQGKELTNFEVLKDKSRNLSDERKKIQDKIMNDYKLPIKRKLLGLASSQRPSLRGEHKEDGAYDGIEGIIFTDRETGEKFKVVDREVFTKINQFNYQVRKGVAGRITSTDENLPIEQRGGVVGEAKVRSIRLFGIPSLELPTQAKKVIEKFKGESREETLKNIADSLNQVNVAAIRRKMQAIYLNAHDDLEEALTAFRQNADQYQLELPNKKKIKYTKEIKRRTLMTFAEAKKELEYMIKKLHSTTDLYDLLEVFLKNQLDAVHSKRKQQ